MLIFWDQRLVFLATPKAGSTAIEMALEPLASTAVQRPARIKHSNLAQWQRHIAPWLQGAAGAPFTTVALMREPLDWLRSWYRFHLRDDFADPCERLKDRGFAGYAEDYCQPGGPDALGIGTQAGFLTDGDSRVDRIFRYEDMPAFVEFLEDRLNCAITLPRVNVPPSVDVGLGSGDEARLRGAMAEDWALYEALG